MEKLILEPIGKIAVRDDGTTIELELRYAPALAGLEGFGYVQVLWWFSGCDNATARATLTEESPYKKGPAVLGTFATRSPQRPNPLALSCARVTSVDRANGVIGLAYIDAQDDSPVLDIKPYTPSLDRVEEPEVPDWCAHWPQSTEASGAFDWEAEFNF
jgi:tRNA-Thr(GGU) m(6)t(6)A37 methyltransferase TsaA